VWLNNSFFGQTPKLGHDFGKSFYRIRCDTNHNYYYVDDMVALTSKQMINKITANVLAHIFLLSNVASLHRPIFGTCT